MTETDEDDDKDPSQLIATYNQSVYTGIERHLIPYSRLPWH